MTSGLNFLLKFVSWACCRTLSRLDERMLILVDIDKLMSSAEMGLIEKLAA